MLVRQLVGRFAGQIIEMPYHVAQSCLANGTAALPDAEVRIRGLELTAPPVETPVVEIPDDWRKLHHFKRIALARAINPAEVLEGISAKDADAIIEGYLAANA